jgi:thiol-disulfide isomerase/thioredoxin
VRWRQGLLIVLAALVAGVLGLGASVAIHGPGPLLRSDLGQWALGWWLAREAPNGLAMIGIGDPVPAFALPMLWSGGKDDRALERSYGGEPKPLPLGGRPVLINYWASWCGPCREELPLLAGFRRQQGANGVQVLGVALDNRAEAERFLAATPVALPMWLETPGARDSSARLGNAQGVLPFSVLIGADGRLRKRRFGPFSDIDDIGRWAAEAH